MPCVVDVRKGIGTEGLRRARSFVLSPSASRAVGARLQPSLPIPMFNNALNKNVCG